MLDMRLQQNATKSSYGFIFMQHLALRLFNRKAFHFGMVFAYKIYEIC